MTLKLPSARSLEAIHARLLERYGGAAGLRDPGALSAALARPDNLIAYGGVDAGGVARLAAALAFSIARSRHPFLDGNKRTAFAALLVTLELNGAALDAAETEAAEVMVRVAGGEIDEDGFLRWVEAHLAPVAP